MFLSIVKLAVSTPLVAQIVADDSTSAVIRAGTLTLLAVADSIDGVYIWANLAKDSETQNRWGAFDPLIVSDWVFEARKVLDSKRPDKGNPQFLVTPGLSGEGLTIFIMRVRNDNGWDREPLIVFQKEGEDSPLRLKLAMHRAQAFLDGLHVVRPHATGTPVLGKPIDVWPYPKLGSGYVPTPSSDLRQYNWARVWATYIVDSTGRVRPETIRILLSEDSEYSKEILSVMPRWRYRPARQDGNSISARIFKRFRFEPAAVAADAQGPLCKAFSDSLIAEGSAVRIDPTKNDPLEVSPERTSVSLPQYPVLLLADGLSGWAIVGFVVEQDGSLDNVKLLEATEPEFGAAAMQAVPSLRFKPGLKAGRPVPITGCMPFVFKLAAPR